MYALQELVFADKYAEKVQKQVQGQRLPNANCPRRKKILFSQTARCSSSLSIIKIDMIIIVIIMSTGLHVDLFYGDVLFYL